MVAAARWVWLPGHSSAACSGRSLGPRRWRARCTGSRSPVALCHESRWDQIELWSDAKVLRSRGGKDKGHAAELERFLEACRAGAEWPIPWGDLCGVTWASLGAVRSLRDGAPVEF